MCVNHELPFGGQALKSPDLEIAVVAILEIIKYPAVKYKEAAVDQPLG